MQTYLILRISKERELCTLQRECNVLQAKVSNLTPFTCFLSAMYLNFNLLIIINFNSFSI